MLRDLGEMISGIRAVASPIFGPSGKLIGSLVITGTFARDFDKAYGMHVATAATKFSESIGGTQHQPFNRPPAKDHRFRENRSENKED